MPNKQRAAAWFVNNVVENRFKDLAKAKKFAIQNVNNEINKMKNAPLSSSSKDKYQECSILFKAQSRPTLCDQCKKLFHRSCHKEHTNYCTSPTLSLHNETSTSSTGPPVSSAVPVASLRPSFGALTSSQHETTTVPAVSSTSVPLNSSSSTIVPLLPPTALPLPNPKPSSSNTPSQTSSPTLAASNNIPKKNQKRKQKASPPVCQKEATIEFLQNELKAAQTRIVQLDADIKDKDQQLSVQHARIKILEDKHNQDILDKYFPHKDKETVAPDPPPPSHHCSQCAPPPCTYHRSCNPAPNYCSSKHPCQNLDSSIPEDLVKKVENISNEMRHLLGAVNTLNDKVDDLEQFKASHTNKSRMYSVPPMESPEEPVPNSNDASIVSIEDLMSDDLDTAADKTDSLPLNSLHLTNHLL